MQISRWVKTTKILLICLLLAGLLIGCQVLPDSGDIDQTESEVPQLPQPKTLTDPREIELNSVIQKAAAGREDVLAFIIFRITIDHVEFSPNETLALVYFSLVDKDTGQVQNSEPGMVIAHATGDSTNPWRVVFQADPDFAQDLMAIPETMISQEAKEHYMPAQQQQAKDGTVYTGYRLPWTKGKGVYLTGSIGHVFTYKSCPSTCMYAFDFANGSMFEIKAAKHGFVKYAQWTYENGNTTNANYLILEDPDTTPTTYQVYYHLAKDSIPAALRVAGAEVMQGQYIGNADDTGYSTGNHLHFHVHTAPNSVWGTSVDIVFDEVGVNGGRPRTCSEASAYPDYGSECVSGNLYYSQNGDVATPTGNITSPAIYSVITSPTVNVSGWMYDDTALESGQILYNTGGDWIAIGDAITVTPFTKEINLCDAGIPDGTFFLSLLIKDQAGKYSTDSQGLTELTKSYDCPALPPACEPAENQMALYTEAQYQGTCQVFDIGEYANLGSLATSFLDNTRSMEVGSGVTVLLYPDVDFAGGYEMFQDGDSNLADNSIGAYNAASMKVLSRITMPQVPTLDLPEVITSSTDLTLAWTVEAGAQTHSTLSGPDDFYQVLDWQDGGSWYVGPLAMGDYTWLVEATNLIGTASITQEFTVTEPSVLPLSHLNDLPDVTNTNAVLLTWEVDQEEDSIDHFEIQYRTTDGEWTDWSETPGADSREMVFWGTPGVQFEFRLRAVDTLGNAEEYLSVAETTTYFIDTCNTDSYEGDIPGDDDITGASSIAEGETQSHNWCAPIARAETGTSDAIDWISFTATTGDSLQFTTSPTGLASAASMTLYETDGVTYIGEANAENSNASAQLNWTAPADGVYYLKLTPADSRIRGTDTTYDIGIEKKSSLQPGTLVCGSAAIPVLVAGGYAVSKQVKKVKKNKERKVLGR